MLKKALLGLAALAVLGAAALFWAWHSLDVIVKQAIEYYGPDLLGVPITVRHVELSTTDGRGALKGVAIGNPKGFSAPRALFLGEMRVAIDPATITDPVVVIRELTLIAPEIAYEKGAGGRTNLDAIQRNIEAYVARGAGSSPPPDSKPGKPGKAAPRRYVIERLTIRNARVTMTNPALRGQGITFTLPDIEMRDLGRLPHGITAGEAASRVAGTLTTRIAQRLLTSLDLLRRGGVDGAIDALKGLVR